MAWLHENEVLRGFKGEDEMKTFLLIVWTAAIAHGAMATVRYVPGEYPTIQLGIDSAVEGDTVLVADGVYSGDGNRDIDFNGKAIVVLSENGPEFAIINCEGNESDPHRGFYFHSGERRSSVLRGFTIKNGYTSEYGGWPQNCGGGILCFESSPTIRGNIISGNTSGFSGGGIACLFFSVPVIDSNVIIGNRAYYAAGIACDESDVSIRNNTIARNSANAGGGIGADLSSLFIDRCTITENNADAKGGGIFLGYFSSAIVMSSIFWDDSANTGKEIYWEGSSIRVSYSDVEGGWEGVGNIDADPLFALVEHRDYRLLWGSPCIDAGHPYLHDPDGTLRDMGAYYFDQSHPVTIYLTPDTIVVKRLGELGVTYTLVNIEPEPRTFYLQTDIFLPSGMPYPGNPIIGPLEVILQGEETKRKRIRHTVPGKAPLGIYSYETSISPPADDIIDMDSFEFEVTPDILQ
jgi:hypothetical protein